MPKFGDIGTETARDGERKVMWLAPDRVVILSTTIPLDAEPADPVVVGDVTYEVMTTKWSETPENE